MPASAQSSKPVIEDLSARIEDDRAWVSYDLVGVMDAEVEERIQSGIPVTFRHKLEVLSKRSVLLWPSKVSGPDHGRNPRRV